MQRTLITVLGSRHSIDLEVPADAPVQSLMPLLLSICEDFTADMTALHLSRWRLHLQSGVMFQPNWSLRDAGVRDGARLVLRAAGAPSSGATPAAPLTRPQQKEASRWHQGITIHWDSNPER